MTELCENLVDGLLRLGHRLYDVSPSPHEIKQKIALLKVLEANKGLFPKVERSAVESVVKATKTADRSETDGFARADRETKTSSRVDRLANGILAP